MAIKTNNISLQHTRSAVLAKICHSLTETLGVKPVNIHIYDGTHGGHMSKNTPFAGLPEGCRVEDDWGGIAAETVVPEPWQKRAGRSKCLKYLVDGTVDILINIAMCKGHSDKFGGFTMTMKNHFGTFDPGPGHRGGAQDYLLAINQTPEILGPMDPHTGQSPLSAPATVSCTMCSGPAKAAPEGIPDISPTSWRWGCCLPWSTISWRPSSAAKRWAGRRIWRPLAAC